MSENLNDSVQDLPSDMKKRHEFKKTCISSLTPEFPEDCKFYLADTKDELHKVKFIDLKHVRFGPSLAVFLLQQQTE